MQKELISPCPNFGKHCHKTWLVAPSDNSEVIDEKN